MWEKFILAGACIVFGSLCLTSCGKNEQEADATAEEEIKLSIYAQYADEDTKFPYDYAVEKLKEAYPNVSLVLDVQAQDDGQKLQTYAVTGNLPDIYQAGKQQIESFKESGNIMVLNKIVKTTGFDEKINEDARNILYDEDGNVYAFPYAGNEVVVWYYNKELFEKYDLEVPKTFDELYHVVEVFQQNDIIPMALFGKEKWITTAFYDVIATRYDSGGIKSLDGGQITTLNDGYIEAAKVIRKLAYAGMFPQNVTNLNYDQAAELFYSGKAAMMLNGQWEMASAYQKMGDAVDWMYYPSYSESAYETGKNAWAGGGTIGGYAVNPNSAHSELAAEVAAFIAEKYCEAKFLYRSNPFVTVKISKEPVNQFNEMTNRLLDATRDVTYTRFSWGLSNAIFKTEIEDQTQLLLTSQYTEQEFCEEMEHLLSDLRER